MKEIIMLLEITGVISLPFIAIFIIDYIYIIKQERKQKEIIK